MSCIIVCEYIGDNICYLAMYDLIFYKNYHVQIFVIVVVSYIFILHVVVARSKLNKKLDNTKDP